MELKVGFLEPPPLLLEPPPQPDEQHCKSKRNRQRCEVCPHEVTPNPGTRSGVDLKGEESHEKFSTCHAKVSRCSPFIFIKMHRGLRIKCIVFTFLTAFEGQSLPLFQIGTVLN